MLLFIDTETTGKYSRISTLIRPSGWTIEREAQDIHGISLEECDRYGIDFGTAFSFLWSLSHSSEIVIAHNTSFDDAMIQRECSACMIDSMDILKIPAKYPKPGQPYKWPSLAESYQHFFGKPNEGAHGAMADCLACAQVYFAINGNMEAANLIG
jgi:DNA polymerase III epsilon subunit-like protein